MRVILLDNIRGIGRVGDVKDVSDGYARNFLLPRSLARKASDAAIKDVEVIKAKKLAAAQLADEQAAVVAEKLADGSVTLSGKANRQGKLFASLEPEDIAAELSGLAGVRIEPGAIELPEPLKTTGEHEVTVHLTENVTARAKVVVEAEK